MATTDETSKFDAMRGLEPADAATLANRTPGKDGIETFQALPSQFLELEGVADQTTGLLAEQNLPGFGKALQSGRKVGRQAAHRFGITSTRADQIADYDLSRGNADTTLKHAAVALNTPDGLHGVEPGPDRTLRLVLVCPRPAEVGKHTVAQILRDMSAVARYRTRHGILVTPHDIAQVFRIEPPGEGGRADQIAKHYRQLTALGRVCSLLRRGGGVVVCRAGIIVVDLPNSAQQSFSIPYRRNADLLEIDVLEIPQNIEINGVFGKYVAVFAESDVFQPVTDVISHR